RGRSSRPSTMQTGLPFAFQAENSSTFPLPSGHARSCDWPNRFHPDRPDPTTQPAAPNRLYERIVAEFAGKLGADVVCISDAGFVTGLAPRRYAQYGCLTNLSRLV